MMNESQNKLNLLSRMSGSQRSLPPSLCSSTTSISTVPSVGSMAKIQRRRAGVSRKVMMPSKNDAIEGGKKIRRTVKRRYAITKYSQIPIRSMRSLRKYETENTVIAEHYVDEPPSLHDYHAVVFKEDNSIDREFEGSQQFLAILNMYYEESYQNARSNTHRSIIRSTILSDVKSHNFSFMKKSSSQRGRFFTVETDYLLSRIEEIFSLEDRSKSSHAYSA